MPAPKKGYSLGSSPSHQRLMLRGMARSLFEHERLTTTESRAKLLRPYAEKLITKARKGGIHDRRQVLSDIGDREVVHKLFAEIGPRFAGREGGYTRILKLGPRHGDAAPMALIELVDQAAPAEDEPGAETETETEAAGEGRRGRLRRGSRRSADLPQDKPARSRAAEAAAAGTGPGPDVESPPGVDAAQAEADRAGAEEAARAEQLDAEHGEADTGQAPGRRETRSGQESKQD